MQQTKRKTGVLPAWLLTMLVPVLVFFNMNAAQGFDSKDLKLLRSPDKILTKLKSEEITGHDVPNPHWEEGACQACHSGSSGFNRSNLRTHDIDHMCGNCHNGYTKAAFIHPTGATISDQLWSEIPDVFRQSMETIPGNLSHRVTCLSCHDLKLQCLKSNRKLKTTNSSFFRLGPFQDRVELCFYCHDAGLFERFNPHKQIIRGKIDSQTCELCHLNTDKLTSKTKTQNIRLRSSDDLTKLCINCHPWRPHPGWDVNVAKKKSANHLTKPPKKMKRRMRSMKAKMQVNLPIGRKSGKINCTTCHNPHQKGVVKSKLTNAGADSKHRLRLKKSCIYCHDV